METEFEEVQNFSMKRTTSTCKHLVHDSSGHDIYHSWAPLFARDSFTPVQQSLNICSLGWALFPSVPRYVPNLLSVLGLRTHLLSTIRFPPDSQMLPHYVRDR